MKFDFVIGNPPYQEEQISEDTDGSLKNYAPPVYHFFMDAAYQIADKVELITPARFLFNAGSTPKDWNKKMLNDEHFKVLYFEPDSSKIFKNTDKVKITPNTKLVLKKYYTQCNHTINTYVELPKELVNLDEQELKKEYEGWKVDKFTQDEVILLKEENAFCDEHYIIKEYSGRIAIYKINKNGAEILEKVTSISTEYLTEHDLLNIKNGIKVYGTEQLNKTLEDYE